MSTLSKKLEELKGNLSYVEFAEAIRLKTGHDIHPTTLQKYITCQRAPSLKTIEVLAQYGNIPLSDLISDDNKELKQKVQRLEKLKSLRDKHDELSGTKEISVLPGVSTLIAGGLGAFLLAPLGLGFAVTAGAIAAAASAAGVATGSYLLPKAEYKDETYAFRAQDDTMTDVGILPGDLVFVRQQKTAKPGQTIIAKIEDEVVCKRYYLKGDMPILEPSDPKYVYFDNDGKYQHTSFEIIGAVTKVIRELE